MKSFPLPCAVIKSVIVRNAGFGRDDRAVRDRRDIAPICLIAGEKRVHDAHAFRGGEKTVPDADEAARRDREIHMRHMIIVHAHIFHHAEPFAEHFDDRSGEFFRHFDRGELHRFQFLSIRLL